MVEFNDSKGKKTGRRGANGDLKRAKGAEEKKKKRKK